MKVDTSSHQDNSDRAMFSDERVIDNHELICEDFLESFMKGNFSRVNKTLEKLDQIKT